MTQSLLTVLKNGLTTCPRLEMETPKKKWRGPGQTSQMTIAAQLPSPDIDEILLSGTNAYSI